MIPIQTMGNPAVQGSSTSVIPSARTPVPTSSAGTDRPGRMRFRVRWKRFGLCLSLHAQGDRLLRDFTKRVTAIVSGEDQRPQAAPQALAYRYLKRPGISGGGSIPRLPIGWPPRPA
jgi:hypothetical protein